MIYGSSNSQPMILGANRLESGQVEKTDNFSGKNIIVRAKKRFSVTTER